MIFRKNIVLIIAFWVLLLGLGAWYIYFSRLHPINTSPKSTVFRDPTTLINGGDYSWASQSYEGLIASEKDAKKRAYLQVRAAFVIFLEGESLNDQSSSFAKGKKVLEDIDTALVSDYFEYYRVLGFGYETIRKYPEALSNYELALAKYGDAVGPDKADILSGRAHMYLLQGDIKPALDSIILALAADPENLFANRMYFRVLVAMGVPEKAILIGEKLIPQEKKKEDLAELFYALSNLTFSIGDAPKSLEYARKCSETKSEYAPCYVALAKLYLYHSDVNARALALPTAEKAVLLAPDSSIAELVLAMAQANAGKYDNAILNYRNAIEIGVKNDTNLLDSEKEPLIQELVIRTAMAYSQKKDAQWVRYYLWLLVPLPQGPHPANFDLLTREIAKGKDGAFAYAIDSMNLLSYLTVWQKFESSYTSNSVSGKSQNMDTASIYSAVFHGPKSYLGILSLMSDPAPVIAACNIHRAKADSTGQSLCILFESAAASKKLRDAKASFGKIISGSGSLVQK